MSRALGDLVGLRESPSSKSGESGESSPDWLERGYQSVLPAPLDVANVKEVGDMEEEQKHHSHVQ